MYVMMIIIIIIIMCIEWASPLLLTGGITQSEPVIVPVFALPPTIMKHDSELSDGVAEMHAIEFTVKCVATNRNQVQ